MMNVAEWILVIMLAVTLLIFLIVAIALLVKLMHVAEEIEKFIIAGQGIAEKADDIIDNVKGMTSVGGIVRTFAKRAVENQERRYAEEDAAREEAIRRAGEEAEAKARAETARRSPVFNKRSSSTTKTTKKTTKESKK